MIDLDETVNAAAEQVFGEEFTYHPRVDQAYTILGIFHDGFRRQVFDNDDTPTMATSDPVVGVRAIRLRAAFATNDRVIRKKTGVAYRLAEPQPDGVGWINFKLKVSA